MDLSTLPSVVLDILLELLDLESLFAISATCQRLHTEVNRIFYRGPSRYVDIVADKDAGCIHSSAVVTIRLIKIST
jgi:hypothetical protein